MPRLDHLLIFVAVRTLYLFFELLPVCAASALGGWLGRNLGPWLPVTKIARKNLQRVLPERTSDHHKIIRGMYDNFGRVFAEYPHLKTIAASRAGADIEIVDLENLNTMRDMNRGGFILTAHLANWEFGTYVAAAHGVPMHVVYRPPNNPLVDSLLASARAGAAVSNIVKGAAGARQIIGYLKNKEFIGILVDQKMNDGIAVPFMGTSAMTADAVAQMAIKYQVPICLALPERISGIHFRWTVLPPFVPARGDNSTEIMTKINNQIGDWVRARPEQWLWIHNRWGKDTV